MLVSLIEPGHNKYICPGVDMCKYFLERLTEGEDLPLGQVSAGGPSIRRLEGGGGNQTSLGLVFVNASILLQPPLQPSFAATECWLTATLQKPSRPSAPALCTPEQFVGFSASAESNCRTT